MSLFIHSKGKKRSFTPKSFHISVHHLISVRPKPGKYVSCTPRYKERGKGKCNPHLKLNSRYLPPSEISEGSRKRRDFTHTDGVFRSCENTLFTASLFTLVKFIKSPGFPVRAPNLPGNTSHGFFSIFFIDFNIF